MNTAQLFCVATVFLLLSGCASGSKGRTGRDVAGSESDANVPNRLEYVESTNSDAESAYQAVKLWVAKTFSNRNGLDFEDPKTHRFLFKTKVGCTHKNARGEWIVQGEFPLTLQFEAKEKKVRMVFFNPTPSYGDEPVRDSALKDVEKKCVNRYREEIISAISAGNDW